MQLVRTTKRSLPSEGVEFLQRLAGAQFEGRVDEPDLVDAMIGRGADRHTPRRETTDDQIGDWN